MNSKRIFSLVLVHALALTLFGATFAFASGEGEQVEEPTEVRFVEVGWLDIEATTATTRLVLESLGYETTSDVVSVPVAYEALAAGDADVFLGNWMPSMESISEPFMEEGTVENVRANLEGAKYTLAVPQYAYDAGVTNVNDLADYEEEFGGEIYGIEAGN
ncbi:MAG: glycine betaine ABC transporter substrate-binding protein, partial [Spirochaetia bacterium]